MNNLIISIKNMFNQNKIGILSLLFFSVLIQLELSLFDTNDINFGGIIVVILFLTMMASFINEIIIIKNYMVNKLSLYDIEYNSYKTIILQSLKIYLKYILLAFVIITIMVTIMGCVFIFTDSDFWSNVLIIFDESGDVNDTNEYIDEYFDEYVSSSKTINLFGIVIISIIFFKLLFIEHILIFRQESYKIKNIVEKSKSIIRTNKVFFIITYFGYALFYYFGEEMLFKNNYIFLIFCSIVDILLFMIYLIKFSEIKKDEYNASLVKRENDL